MILFSPLDPPFYRYIVIFVMWQVTTGLTLRYNSPGYSTSTRGSVSHQPRIKPVRSARLGGLACKYEQDQTRKSDPWCHWALSRQVSRSLSVGWHRGRCMVASADIRMREIIVIYLTTINRSYSWDSSWNELHTFYVFLSALSWYSTLCSKMVSFLATDYYHK